MRLRRKPWIDDALPEVRDQYIYLDGMDRFKGHWREQFQGREVCLEIGSGKGAFITGMAALHPEKAFIGVESQLGVAYYPAKKAKDEGLTNLKMICGDAACLDDWFETGEIRTLYLNFSDPWPKARHAKRRLTHVNFLALYFKLLGPGGTLYFKTDNRGLFDFSVEQFRLFGMEIRELSYDLHHSGYVNEVQTEYERKFSGRGTPINYCAAVFTAASGRDVATRPPRNLRPSVRTEEGRA